MLPIQPEFEFLRARCYNKLYDVFRIKSMKMGGVYSEVICFKIKDILPNFANKPDGTDVTNLLGISKYDPEALEESRLVKNKKHGPIMTMLLRIPFFKNILYPKKKNGKWPDFISKTDETRVQSLTYVFEKYKGLAVYVTEKLDGQSATFFYRRKEFGVCSRNLRLPRPAAISGKHAVEKSKYWQTAEKYDIEKKLKKASKDMGIDLYIQGEQCGPGIQGNKYGFTELKLFVFNVYDITHKRYFSGNEILEFCNTYGFDMVPTLGVYEFDWQSVDELVTFAKGYSIYGDKVLREGVVIRSEKPMPPDRDMSNMLSFKVINPGFAVKWGSNDYSA